MRIDIDEHDQPIRVHLTRDEWNECTEFDESDWEPLERHLPESLWGDVTWMYRVRPEKARH